MYKHYISKVVLKQFATPATPTIGVLDLNRNECTTGNTKRLGGVADEDLPEPDAIENVWRRDVENRLPHVIKQLKAGVALDDPKAVETLGNCIALHFARSRTLLDLVTGMLPDQADQVTDTLLETFTATSAVHALTGLYVTGPAAEQILRDRVRADLGAKLRESRFVDKQSLQHYRTGQARVAKHKIEVWHSPSAEFVIADTPVVLYGGSEARVGVRAGIAWDTAEAVFMPVHPHYAVALSKENSWQEATPEAVVTLNRLQVKSAAQQIFFRPNTGPGEEIAKALRESAKNGS